MEKIRLYIDCDGVILDTIATARRLAKEKGINPNDFDELHEFFLSIDWNILIYESGILDNAISKIKRIIASGKYDVSILTKLCGNETEELAKRIILSKLLPDVPIITLDLAESKHTKVNPVDAILIEDSLHNHRGWIKAGGISVLFLKGEYIYDYPDEKRITEEEKLNIVDDILKFEETDGVKRLLKTRQS